MNELAIAGATILSCEIFLWLPLPATAKTLMVTLQKSQKVLVSKHITDERKEKIIPFYALQIFKNSLLLTLLLAILALPIMMVSWLFSPSLASAVIHLSQPLTLLIMIITSICYLMIRVKFKK